MAKNYLIIRTTGTSAYSTSVQVFKLVQNTPVKIGSLEGQTQDTCVRYLYDVLKKNGVKLTAEELSQKCRSNEIVIHEIYV